MRARLGSGDCLLAVDVQRDFCPGGALAVDEGDAVVPALNRWIREAVAGGSRVVASRDWHPPGHVSFAPQGGPWPAHCVRGTVGAGFHDDLDLPPDALIVSKAEADGRDSYSAFDGTDLAERLRAWGIRRVFVGGLALDYCVRATALDALREGFAVHVIEAATRPVDINPGDGVRALAELAASGAVLER
jgi:nicotinamidase/pyrazinamidase